MEKLDWYSRVSRQVINTSKSQIFFSPNTAIDLKLKWNSLHIRSVSTLGRYLGFNFNFSRHKVPHFHSLLDKINSKLQGWKAKLLSQAGGMTLIKSVISSLPLYTFSCFKIPEVTWIGQCNFWWGHENEHRKLHMVGQDALCQPIWRGGQSIKKLCWLIRSR